MSNKKDKDGIESLFHFRQIVKAKQLNILYGFRIAFPFASAKFSIHGMRSRNEWAPYISKPFLYMHRHQYIHSFVSIQILPPIHSVKSSMLG